MLQELPKCERESWSKHMLGKWHLATSLQLKQKTKKRKTPTVSVKYSKTKCNKMRYACRYVSKVLSTYLEGKKFINVLIPVATDARVFYI